MRFYIDTYCMNIVMNILHDAWEIYNSADLGMHPWQVGVNLLNLKANRDVNIKLGTNT